MKPIVLSATPLMDYAIAKLEADYEFHRLDQAADKAALLAEIGPSVRGIVTNGKADAELMAACPKLEIVSSFGVGYDGVDVGYAGEHDIVVCNTPDVLNDEVANTAIVLLLAVYRKIVEYDKYVRAGRWPAEGDPPLTRSVSGKRIGIVGLGRIGKTIAEKLQVFGCEIAYHGRTEQADVAYAYHADPVSLAAASDAIIVITPGGAATQRMIDRQVIEALGPDGVLINVARGSVVDEAALVAALADGRLGAAGLDVFENEPNVPEALFALDNVTLQPHQGSATIETRQAMADRMLINLANYFAGNPPLSRVV